MGDDSTLESALRGRIGELQPAEALELSGAAGIATGIAGDLRGRLRVERDSRGFTVEIESQLEGGAAEPGASARIGLASGTKFRVASAAEAADLCDALIKGATVNSTNMIVPGASLLAEGAHFMGVKGDLIDANARVRGYLGQVSEARLDVTGSANLGGSAKFEAKGFNFAAFENQEHLLRPLSARTQLQAREGISFDFDKGELRQNIAITGTGEAFFKIPLVINSGANAKATVTVSLVRQMPPEVKEALKDGRMTPAEAWARLATSLPDRIVVKGVIDAGGRGASPVAMDTRVRLTGEYTLPLAEFAQRGLDPEWLGSTLAKTRLKAESEVGLGAGIGADLTAVKGEVWLTKRNTHVLAEGTLGEVAAAASDFLTVSNPSTLEAQRAVHTLN